MDTQRLCLVQTLHHTHKMQKRHTSALLGVFTAPIALQLLTELFLENSNLDNLQKFISDNGQNIYKNLEFSPKEVVLEEREFTIPNRYGELLFRCLMGRRLIFNKRGEMIAKSVEDLIGRHPIN